MQPDIEATAARAAPASAPASTGATTCMEVPHAVALPPSEAEVAALRAERALLGELLAAPPAALARYTGAALIEQRRLRALVARRTRDPEAFRRKLLLLQRRCARLARRGLLVPVPQLAHGFEAAARAFGLLAEAREPGGDEFLPAQELLELALTDLALVAVRTGAQPPTRRRAQRAAVHRPSRPVSHGQGPQLALALEQLANRVASEQGKRLDLTLLGLEAVPREMSGAVFDLGSQLLRNAIERGIDVPARRTAAGKSAAGQVLVEFRLRGEGRAELVVQDDGLGVHPDRLADSGREHARAMALVGRRVRGLQGQMQVASRRHQYTRVRIRLPLPSAVALATRPPAAPAAPAIAPGLREAG